MKKNTFTDEEGYELRPIRMEDREKIREWRNAQIDILRQDSPLSKEDQDRYFKEVVAPLFSMERPPQILFSFFLNGKLVGYGGLTWIRWPYKHAEISFLADQKRHEYFQDFKAFLELIKRVAFEELGFHRIYSESYAFRTELHPLLERLGFKKEGVLREHMFKRGKWTDSIVHGLLATD